MSARRSAYWAWSVGGSRRSSAWRKSNVKSPKAIRSGSWRTVTAVAGHRLRRRRRRPLARSDATAARRTASTARTTGGQGAGSLKYRNACSPAGTACHARRRRSRRPRTVAISVR
jgi:hypothetical protein